MNAWPTPRAAYDAGWALADGREWRHCDSRLLAGTLYRLSAPPPGEQAVLVNGHRHRGVPLAQVEALATGRREYRNG
jgi:hypothetical protein